MDDLQRTVGLADHVRLVAEASRVLIASSSDEAIAGELARLCVRSLAQWCVVDLTDRGEHVRRVAAARVDPASMELLRQVEAAGFQDPEYFTLRRELGPEAYAVVPLLLNDRRIGGITLFGSPLRVTTPPDQLRRFAGETEDCRLGE
jgi:hypothetical protein